MGLLDDAIREHLELKRRHGADPEEVSRQEREALGAPQRSAEFAQPGDARGEPTPPTPGRRTPRTLRGRRAGRAAPPVDAEEAELAAPRRRRTPRRRGGGPVAPGRRARAEEPPSAPSGARAPPAEGEDVLEETPEFLQETPEHDRLWFEQKPPRDFDWDK